VVRGQRGEPAEHLPEYWKLRGFDAGELPGVSGRRKG